MPEFPIIDTHLHLWDPKNIDYPWLQDLPILNRAYLLPEYIDNTRAANVEGMVFIQCEADFAQAMKEAKWVVDLAKQESRIKGIIPWAPLEKGEGCHLYLDELKQMPLIKGVRRIIQFESDLQFCLYPGFVKGVQMLTEYNFSFDICISPDQLKNTIKLVEQCPEVNFVLDHIGKPDIKGQVFEPWQSELKMLSGFPNVWCKISGLVVEANIEHWTKEDLKPFIKHVINCFGVDRVMFGGDWPVVLQAAEWQKWVEALDWSLKDYSITDQKKIYHDNAIKFYKLEL
ncbi:MAG: amidohydrolase family protein [Deltaproteobacteria bacterium]|jgi:L-fuconolactonase|nr:amidohydrolase family protein [Deltaproteobacteria bacterium]